MGRQARTLPRNDGAGKASEYLGNATTASSFVSVPNYGLSNLTSAANTYVLDAPEAGVQKWLFRAAGSSAATVVKLHPVSSGDSILVGAAGTEVAFNSTDHCLVGLVGVSSVRWAIMSATTGATPVNTTGIVFQAS
jgi:hypothetical protein